VPVLGEWIGNDVYEQQLLSAQREKRINSYLIKKPWLGVGGVRDLHQLFIELQ